MKEDYVLQVAAIREETRENFCLREENRELKAVVQIMMRPMQALSESLSGK